MKVLVDGDCTMIMTIKVLNIQVVYSWNIGFEI